MKKILTAVLLIGMMSSCTERNIEKVNTKYVIYDGANPLEVVTVDSCQYLFIISGSYMALTHKGNCNNPIHKGGNK
jgi:hypothetical protein